MCRKGKMSGRGSNEAAGTTNSLNLSGRKEGSFSCNQGSLKRSLKSGDVVQPVCFQQKWLPSLLRYRKFGNALRQKSALHPAIAPLCQLLVQASAWLKSTFLQPNWDEIKLAH